MVGNPGPTMLSSQCHGGCAATCPFPPAKLWEPAPELAVVTQADPGWVQKSAGWYWRRPQREGWEGWGGWEEGNGTDREMSWAWVHLGGRFFTT